MKIFRHADTFNGVVIAQASGGTDGVVLSLAVVSSHLRNHTSSLIAASMSFTSKVNSTASWRLCNRNVWVYKSNSRL